MVQTKGSANCGLWAKCGLPPGFVNESLLKHSLPLWCGHCICKLPHYNDKVERMQGQTVRPSKIKIRTIYLVTEKFSYH